MNEMNPTAVVTAAKKTGRIMYDNAFITTLLLTPSLV